MSDLLPIDRGTGQPITPTIVKLRVFAFGCGQKALFSKAAVVIDETNVILRSLIGEEINKEKKDLCFNEDDHITKVVSADGLDLIELLNFTVSCVRRTLQPNPLEINVTINCPSIGPSSSTNAKDKSNTTNAFADMMRANKAKMTMLVPKYDMEHVLEFQKNFNSKTTSREIFLKNNKNTPNIDEQIEAAIIHVMSNPTNDTWKKCGYYKKGTSNTKNTEELAVWKAVRHGRDAAKFINDHRHTLQSRNKTLFESSPLLKAIIDVDPRGTKQKDNRKKTVMNKGSILAEIDDIDKAISTLPKWYHSKIETGSDIRKGEALLYELEMMKTILTKYSNYLHSQDSRNAEALNRESGSGPDKTNTDIDIINREPSRLGVDKRNDYQKDLYNRVDTLMKKVKDGPFYQNYHVDDVAMGIDGSEWDNKDRPGERRRFISLLGSNRFKIVKYTYRPAGAVSNYVVIVKIEPSASLLHRSVAQCVSEAESKAPQYLSRRETDEAINRIRSSMQGGSVRLAHATLTNILPQNVLLHKSFKKHEKRLLQDTISLLISSDEEDVEKVQILSDLRKLNIAADGSLSSKFEVYWNAIEHVINMNGVGAHRRRHPNEESESSVADTVYVPMINSIQQLASSAKKHLEEEKQLKEGVDFHIPSTEWLRRQFSPSHENVKIASTFTGRLKAKRVLQSKSARPAHAHAHYNAAQKKLIRHHLCDIRKQLEKEEMDVDSPISLSWDYYVEWLGLDDKCGIPVALPDCPVAATAHSTVQAILPEDSECIAADHDYSKFKITPSVSLSMNIGEEPGDSLFSGGVDGNGTIYASLHDATFEKSDNYRHLTSALDILRSKRIRMLVKDGLLPADSLNIKYKDLCAPNKQIVDDHMPFILGFETDGGGDHRNTIFQNFMAYTGFFFASKCDKIFIFRGCPGYSYLNTCERSMALLNIALANLALNIDANTPNWLLKVLSGLGSMKEVRAAIAQYEIDLERAIEIRKSNPLGKNDSSSSGSDSSDEDTDDEESNDEEGKDDNFFPMPPKINAKVKKFFATYGWYNGFVYKIEEEEGEDIIRVKFSDGEEYKWSMDEYKKYAEEASIPVGAVGYRFNKLFECKDGNHPFDGKVIKIIQSSKNRKCQFSDGKTQILTYSQIKLLSTQRFGDESDSDDDSEASSMEEDESDDDVVCTAVPSKAPTGKYFRELSTLTLEELESRDIRTAYSEMMQPPMDTVANRFSQMNLDGRAVEIVDWPDEVSEIVNALKEIEPGFDTSVRSWGQFKLKYPVLYEWFNNHVRHHEYLSEISICDSEACTVCRKLGRNVRTPDTKDGCLRELTL